MNRFFFPLLLVSIMSFGLLNAQQNKTTGTTSGVLTFTVRTVSNQTGYSPKHVLSIWVKDSVGSFVISRKVMANTRRKHLVKWVANSAYNTTNAITGSTLQSHQTHTVIWDGKDSNGNEVPDGLYQVWVEYTSQNSASGSPAGPSTSINFHKGPVNDHQTPANLTYFQDMVLDWVPDGVGIGEKVSSFPEYQVYPNPFTESTSVKIDLRQKSQVQASILNNRGQEISVLINETTAAGIYSFNWDGTTDNGAKVAPGIYLLKLTINGKSSFTKLIRQ